MPDPTLIACGLYGIGAASTAAFLVAMSRGGLPWRWWQWLLVAASVPLWPVAVPVAALACLLDE